MAFRLPLDVINRALVHLGKERIRTLTDHSIQAQEGNAAYDDIRLAELRRNTWRFATRRVILRSVDTDTYLYVPPSYDIGVTYALGAIVSYGNEWWQSQAASNLGNTPEPGSYWQHYYGVDSFTDYDADISYFAGEIVGASDDTIYLSLVNANTTDPVSVPSNWVAIGDAAGGNFVALTILYPIGAGPAADRSSQYVFRLPRGFLRKAPTDPKAGVFQRLGGPVNAVADDWVFEGDYIVAPEVGPVLLRYVADFTDVSRMDPMFCEGLASKIAVEIAPRVVEPAALGVLLANARADYRQIMVEARIVNGIETGPVDPPEDTYITVRW